MKSYSLLIVIATALKIVEELLSTLIGADATAEIMSGTIASDGELVTNGVGGIVGSLFTSKDTFDSDPAAFAANQADIDSLDDVVDGITGIEIGDFATEAGEAYDELQAASPEA